MTFRLLCFVVLVGTGVIGDALAQTSSPQKLAVVAVTGCITQGQGDTWLLTNAGDPVAASAQTTAPKPGKNRYRLIGTLELNVPDHKGHTVTVRGMVIPAKPESRINLTSVQMVAPTCPAS
jgi:hypothetical protein